MNYILSDKQQQQIAALGISVPVIERQLNYFEKGFPFIKLAKPATISDGIVELQDISQLINAYNTLRKGKKIVKFVPASGAASRMFKTLYEFVDKNKTKAEVSLADDKVMQAFFDNIKNFAFYNDLDAVLKADKSSIDAAIKEKKYVYIVEKLLNADGLNYGMLPKGMLKFHRYKDSIRTAIEEHLAEGFLYANNDGQVYLHFTVSPEHLKGFEELVNTQKKVFEQKYNVTYNISFSVQKKSTDTIAVDGSNNPVLEDGKLIFRPGGHGALLENLNDLDGDLIFVKNIDNVVPDHLKDSTVTYKQALAGLLLSYRKTVFEYLTRLQTEKDFSIKDFDEMTRFAETINIHIPPQVKQLGKDVCIKYFRDKFNRPIRVCGMVKNEGEPGGGPFWVDNEGELSIQIVESSQINISDRIQLDIFRRATHFNPVDLVCSIKDFEGKKFNLLDYRDNNTGFISSKSKGSLTMKVQELPGLWNGSMADWITIFVEVPVSTFNPVKTVHDMLRPQHQM